jgi:dTMP kinase
MLYSLNRWENLSLIKKHVDQSDFLIADRYTPSNLAYGVSKGLDQRWLVELDRGLPQPSLVIVLDVPVPASFKRKSEGRDTHESSKRYMARVRQSYRSLARRYGWKLLDGTKPSERVHLEVLELVRGRFRLPRSPKI